jgi:hypothetical protein
MIKTTSRLRLLFCGAALALAPTLTWAGFVNIEPGEGNVPALLLQDAVTYTDAMRNAVIRIDEAILSPGRRDALNLVRNKVRGATLARLEYTYIEDGKPKTRIYHARSGHSLESTIRTAGKKKGNASGSETSNPDSSAGSDRGTAGDSPEEIAADAAEAEYYPADTDVDVRAPKLPPEGSVLEPVEIRPGEGLIHAWDAELKALRKIESDIKRELVPEGGTVTGYVSKTVCESCRRAVETFANEFKADVNIYELVEKAPGHVDDRVSRSLAASKDFSATRRTYANEQLMVGNTERRSPGAWSQVVSTDRLESAEASALVENAEACGAL